MRSVAHIGEFALIDEVKKSCPISSEVLVGIGDDAAVLRSRSMDKGYYQLVTTDMMVENVHFIRKAKPFWVGHKALACNISDIAAMGGVAQHAVISLGLPGSCPMSWVKGFYQGMNRLAKICQISIVGGDTVRSESIVVNVALYGWVNPKHLVLRSGAKVGDIIWVSGALGGSLLSQRHLTFSPRWKEAQWLVRHFKPHAMMDISDGLAGDLNHILKASGVGAILDWEKIPRHRGVSLEAALRDGEDYELLFTLSEIKSQALIKWQQSKSTKLFTPIGRIVRNKKLRIPSKGYEHFSSL